jgi:hypothetical protein
MMKKMIFLLVILSLVTLPMAVQAAVSSPVTPGAIEFTLGGYVKMEADWDSTVMNKNMTQPVWRNNDLNNQHGRLKLTANSTRFNFSFKGPKLWGAQVTGLIEADFDAGGNAGTPADTLNFGNFRLRHAMFRLNWPETELLFGQYWGFFSEFTPETAADSGCQFVGSATHRPPQIRLTQKFLGAYTVSMMVAAPTNMLDMTAWNTNSLTNLTPGESSECPMLQGKFSFEQDLWGKAAFYGVPRGFVAQVAVAWQRTRYRSSALAAFGTWGQDQFGAVFARQTNQQYLNPWMVQGSLFIPLIPTYSANLAGTASISTQWYVGEGLDAFGEAIANNATYLINTNPLLFEYDRQLVKRYGGFVQGQYYFTNQWFLNAVWGMSKAFDVPQDRDHALETLVNPAGYKIALPADLYKFWQEFNLTLWYRPITALKFGLQYSYAKTDWFQKTGSNPALPVGGVGATVPGQRVTGIGENHRVMFAGFFYF